MSQSLAEQLATTALSGANAGFVEDLYEQFLRDPSGIDPTWAAYFKRLQGAVSRLIQVYANRGHLVAKLDPLGLQERGKPYVLDLEYFGLSDADLDTEFFTGNRNPALAERAKLKDILAELKFIYTDTIGAEFAHVSDTDERLWLQDNFQVARMQRRFSVEEKKNILWQLTAAAGLE